MFGERLTVNSTLAARGGICLDYAYFVLEVALELPRYLTAPSILNFRLGFSRISLDFLVLFV